MKFSVLTVSAFMVTKIAMAKKSSDSLPASSESTSLLDGPRNFLRSGRSLSYEEEVDGKSGEYEINWEEMKDLPQARSDFTATLVNGKDVWMLGGCGADQTRAPWDNDMFICPTVVDSCQKYNIATNSYSDCTSLPTANYRHTATLVGGNSIVVAGGRSVEDSLMKDIVSLDIESNTWTTKLSNWKNATSDAAAVAVGTDLYIIGGYLADYTASSRVWKIDTTVSGQWTPVYVGDLLEGRGDIFAVLAGDGSVFVTGGFSHEDWCEALSTVEKWDFTANPWSYVAPTNVGRGDKALVRVNDHIFAIGGETKVNCETTAVHDVEVYISRQDKWVVATEIPEETFRFVAVGKDDTDDIFIFGGQEAYDATCDCHKLSKSVLKYHQNFVITEIDAPATKPVLGWGLLFVFATATAAVASF